MNATSSVGCVWTYGARGMVCRLCGMEYLNRDTNLVHIKQPRPATAHALPVSELSLCLLPVRV